MMSVPGEEDEGRRPSAGRRLLLLVVAVTWLLAACGGGEASLAAYADEVEGAVAKMRSRILATDAALEQPTTSVAEAEEIWRERAAARREFLDALAVIKPPDEATELHAAATGIVGRLAEAEAGVADHVRDAEDLSQIRALGSTPEFREFIAVNEEATNICLAAQGMFDDTKRREVFEDVPWITDELKTVIEVVFDCLPGAS